MQALFCAAVSAGRYAVRISGLAQAIYVYPQVANVYPKLAAGFPKVSFGYTKVT